MRLSDLKKGKKAVVIKVHGYGLLRKRLSEIGFIRGKIVQVVYFAPLGDPVVKPCRCVRQGFLAYTDHDAKKKEFINFASDTKNKYEMTEISTLGEFGLIKHLAGGLKPINDSTVKGVGDDAAILNYSGDGNRVLVTTDMLLEGIHFDLTYVPLKHLGYKAAIVNFSDIYAMNGRPKQITVSIGLSKRFSVEDCDALYAGIRLACERYGVDLAGGDTCPSMTGLTICITCIGEAAKDKVTTRSGAGINDVICVSGNLGAAYMGLQLLEREKNIFNQTKGDMQPDFAGKEYILQRQLKPEARKDIIEKLENAGIVPTSMMDISDGLSSELLHICEESGCGCRIYEDKIPIDYETASMAEEFNMNLVTAALNGGEDYELLFTVPLSRMSEVEKLEDVKTIGYITDKENGCLLVTRDGAEITLKAQGWNPLAEEQE